MTDPTENNATQTINEGRSYELFRKLVEQKTAEQKELNLMDALAWAKEQLEKSGVPVPKIHVKVMAKVECAFEFSTMEWIHGDD